MEPSKINRRLVNYEVTEFYCVNANPISLLLFLYNGSGQTCGGWNWLLYSVCGSCVRRDLREVGGEKLMIVIINEDYQVKVDNYANYTLLKAVRDEYGALKVGKDKSNRTKDNRLLFQHEASFDGLYSFDAGR